MADEKLLVVDNLKMHFHTRDGVVKAVDGVSYELNSGETLGVVGESGSGKSVTALTMMRLIPMPPGRIEGGDVLFRGESLLKMSDDEIRKIRGNRIAMVFQDPMTSLNPVYRVGRQIAEPLILHKNMSKKDAWKRAVELLDLVGIPSPRERAKAYPHELSGGQRQRVMIAMALACEPELLIADEPTTALDVTVQAQILELLTALQRERGMALMLITHDLAVVSEVAHRVVVMYAGRIVEHGPVREMFRSPLHPYTRGLLASIPGVTIEHRLPTIAGAVPALGTFPSGCRFHPRCQEKFDPCSTVPPSEDLVAPGHGVYCHLHHDGAR